MRNILLRHIVQSVGIGLAAAAILWLAAGSEYREFTAGIDAAAQKGNPEYEYIAASQKEDPQNGYDTALQKKDPQNGCDTSLQKEDPQNGCGAALQEIKEPLEGERYGWIISEDIDLKSYLYYGDSKTVLEKGIGQYAGSSLPGSGGTILACGHDTTYCSGLQDARAGDKIQIQTSYGTFTYKVVKTAVVKASDISACRLDSKKEQLVLYTCYPFGEKAKKGAKRFFVYCTRISDAGANA